MNVVLGSMVGSIIGLIVASVVRPPYPFFKFTIIQIGIGKHRVDAQRSSKRVFFFFSVGLDIRLLILPSDTLLLSWSVVHSSNCS